MTTDPTLPKIKLHCLQCGWQWTSRLTHSQPRVCPRCKRYNWSELPKEAA